MKISQELNNSYGIAIGAFNLAGEYALLGDITRALSLAQVAGRIWSQLKHPNAKRAQDLIDIFQGGGDQDETLDQIDSGSFAAALDAFLHTDSLKIMQIVVEQHPILKSEKFIRVTQEIILDPPSLEQKAALEVRLAWLKQITAK